MGIIQVVTWFCRSLSVHKFVLSLTNLNLQTCAKSFKDFLICGIIFKDVVIRGKKTPLVAWARICKRLRRPGIDSEDSIPPAYVAWQADTTNRVVVPGRQAGNQFLGSLNTGSVQKCILYISSSLRVVFPSRFVEDGAQLCNILNSEFSLPSTWTSLSKR